MKAYLICVFVVIIFSAAQCKKESVDCHRTITIVNNSNQDVIYSTILYDPLEESQCLLVKRAVLKPNERYNENLKMCWEEELIARDFIIFIADTLDFNTGGFYDCDSIFNYNTILKQYIITFEDLEDLRQNNFTIFFP